MKALNEVIRQLRERAKKIDSLVKVRTFGQLSSSYLSDASRFVRSSGALSNSEQGALEAHITMDYHRLEKGLTLPRPRPWFGRQVIERLTKNCEMYVANYQVENEILGAAVGAATSYGEYFAEKSPPPGWWTDVAERIDQLSDAALDDVELTGGIEKISEHFSPLKSNAFESFQELASRRSSVRNFDDRIVPFEEIAAAVEIAQCSPSVCNRQAGRVRLVQRGPDAERVLSLQNGNAGFGHSASHVLVVTTDLTAFLSAGERNQCFIDGGLFAMTLIYALEDRGIGSCCLNWSTVSSQDGKLRKIAEIPNNEVIIMLIAIGYPHTEALVTKSPKLPGGRVLTHARIATT